MSRNLQSARRRYLAPRAGGNKRLNIVQKDSAIKVALIGAISGLLVSGLALVGTVITVSRPSDKSCAVIIQEYSDTINKNPNALDVIDVAADPNAMRCRLDVNKLRKLVRGDGSN